MDQLGVTIKSNCIYDAVEAVSLISLYNVLIASNYVEHIRDPAGDLVGNGSIGVNPYMVDNALMAYNIVVNYRSYSVNSS